MRHLDRLDPIPQARIEERPGPCSRRSSRSHDGSRSTFPAEAPERPPNLLRPRRGLPPGQAEVQKIVQELHANGDVERFVNVGRSSVEKSWRNRRGGVEALVTKTRPHDRVATQTLSPGVPVFVRCNFRLPARESNSRPPRIMRPQTGLWHHAEQMADRPEPLAGPRSFSSRSAQDANPQVEFVQDFGVPRRGHA
jgi:hypothetical protein